MQSVVLVEPAEPIGAIVLDIISAHRGEFLVDAILDDGEDARWLAELAFEYTPYTVGLTDEYAEAPFEAEFAAIGEDQGLVSWELPSIEIVSGESALAEIASAECDVLVICGSDETARAALDVARSGAAASILVNDELMGGHDDRVTPIGENAEQIREELAADL